MIAIMLIAGMFAISCGTVAEQPPAGEAAVPTPSATPSRSATPEPAANHAAPVATPTPARVRDGTNVAVVIADSPTLPSCGDETDLLTVAPFAPEAYVSIMPLGLLSPPQHAFPSPHLFFHLTRERTSGFTGPTRKSALLSPTHGFVT